MSIWFWWVELNSSLCPATCQHFSGQSSPSTVGCLKNFLLCRPFDLESLQLTRRKLFQCWCWLWLMFPWNEFRIRERSRREKRLDGESFRGSDETYDFASLLVDNSFVSHITFVSKNHSLNICGNKLRILLKIWEFLLQLQIIFLTFVCMLVNISQPLDYVFKTFLICYVVNEHYAHRTTVITCGNCVKAFLTGGLKRTKLEIKYWNLLKTFKNKRILKSLKKIFWIIVDVIQKTC